VEEKEIHDELTSIRSLMERSSKFISLSGLSGILAGIYALIGAGYVYYRLEPLWPYFINRDPSQGLIVGGLILQLVIIAIAVLVASILTCVLLSIRKAKRKGQPIWGNTSKQLLFNMSIPLVAGGLLILILIFQEYYSLIAPAFLIFYGLALISASNFTFGVVKYLGILEIILGLAAACLPGYGLLFWAIGFGVLHIIYGSIMYFKYDG